MSPHVHVVFVHAPLGLLLAVVALRLLALRFPNAYFPALPAITWLSAVGALAAAASGWILIQSAGNQWGALGWWHQWLGSTLAVAMVALAVAAQWTRSTGRSGWLRDSFLLISVGIALVTAHFGGQMTHGRDYLWSTPTPADEERPDADEETTVTTENASSDNPTAAGDNGEAPAQRAEPQTAAGDHQAASGNDEAQLAAAHEQQLWHQAAAVLKEHCLECHQASRNRGYLRMDTHERLMRGGGSGPAVKPGDPGASRLLTLAMLPEDHWDRMPPEGPMLKPEELQVLRDWIAAGAPGTGSLPEAADRQNVQE